MLAVVTHCTTSALPTLYLPPNPPLLLDQQPDHFAAESQRKQGEQAGEDSFRTPYLCCTMQTRCVDTIWPMQCEVEKAEYSVVLQHYILIELPDIAAYA